MGWNGMEWNAQYEFVLLVIKFMIPGIRIMGL